MANTVPITGNQVLSGSWAQVWMDSEMIAECSAITAKVTVNRADVQIGIDMDSKITSLKGEGSLTLHHVYTSRIKKLVDQIKQGKDPRYMITAKCKDPDAVGGQVERWSFSNVSFTEIPIFDWKTGEKAQQEIPFQFTVTKMKNKDAINKK